MKRQWILLGVLTFAVAGLMASPIQAVFVQCVGGACDGTDNSDLINGTDGDDTINAVDGDNVVFANAGSDDVFGGPGTDMLFGGPGSDILEGGIGGNDTLHGGPDDQNRIQELIGDEGSDTYLVLVGETSNCLTIHEFGPGGVNVVNLIGFGPYTVDLPHTLTDLDESYLIVQDPIAGGYVMMHISDPSVGDGTINTINGLLTPNVALVDLATADTFMGTNCFAN